MEVYQCKRCICWKLLDFQRNLVFISAAGGEYNSATVLQNHILELILISGHIEVVHDQQIVFPQAAKKAIMPFEPDIIRFLRKIVGKVYIDGVLPQITHIVHAQNNGVFLTVLLGIHLLQFTLTDTRDSVELHQPLLPTCKPAAGFWHIAVSDCARQIARRQKLLGTHISLFKSQLHGDVGDEYEFIVVVLKKHLTVPFIQFSLN